MNEIAERDVAPLLNRTAALLRDDDRLLDALAAVIDATDIEALRTVAAPVAARAVRRWLERDGYPPTSAGVARVMSVASGEASGCELTGGLRVERRGTRLVLATTGPTSG
jgi:tRNA(Ile)-lysidine synthase